MVIKEFQLALIVNILLIFIEKNSCEVMGDAVFLR